MLKRTLAVCAFVLSCATANAATLTATLVADGSTDWFAEFTDGNADGLFSKSEMTFFSGLTSYPDFVVLLANPDIPGIAAEDGLAAFSPPAPVYFIFGKADPSEIPLGFNRNLWTYEISGLSVVPLPAGGVLILSGLGVVAALGRRKKAA